MGNSLKLLSVLYRRQLFQIPLPSILEKAPVFLSAGYKDKILIFRAKMLQESQSLKPIVYKHTRFQSKRGMVI